MTDLMQQDSLAFPEGQLGRRVVAGPTELPEPFLGRTIVSLLDEAVARNPNPNAFQQLRDGEWQSVSTLEFRTRAEELALGLGQMGHRHGDRVAFFTENDLSFTVPDMACLLAGLVTVPIYLTHGDPNISHILADSEAVTLVVTNRDLLERVSALLPGTNIKRVVVMEGETGDVSVPEVELLRASDLQHQGRATLDREPSSVDQLKAQLSSSDLATIIYTSGTTGVPKGVMLSHENISSNAIAAFLGLEGYRRGPEETVLSFLPLTHIFARTLHYGTMWFGNSVYYSDADSLSEHFREIRPTMLATVPRVLERAYERILARGAELTGTKRRIFDWSLGLAKNHDVESPPGGLSAMRLRLADSLVFSKWREALGGRMRFVIVGAAALRPDLVNIFGAAGINILQGYGLTESSPVICFNRPGANRPGTVGLPIGGVEVSVSERGEILTRGPHVMMGYYKQEEETARTVIDGWLHTGDLGEIDEDGFISLSGRLKNLFKLSTGKYVMSSPIEQALEVEPLVDFAVVVGEGEKYCGALLFLNEENLAPFRVAAGGDAVRALQSPELQERLRAAVVEANGDLPPWSTVKRVVAVQRDISIENEMLTPTLKLRRKAVMESFGPLLEALYRPVPGLPEDIAIIDVERR